MRQVRRWHTYLSCFFAPLLLFYIGTGWYQTFNLDRTKGLAERKDWVSKLRSVHVDQIYPGEKVDSYSTTLFKAVVVAMSICLIVTIALGIYLAFRSSKQPWPVWVSLVLGILVPGICLWLGQGR